MSNAETKSVLVVDDDAQVLESTCSLLGGMGFRALACRESRFALEMLGANTVDVVLSDIRMPGLTGLELLDRIRAGFPDLPVVLMTAFAEVDLAMGALSNGAFDFILKPYKPDVAATVARAALCRDCGKSESRKNEQ